MLEQPSCFQHLHFPFISVSRKSEITIWKCIGTTSGSLLIQCRYWDKLYNARNFLCCHCTNIFIQKVLWENRHFLTQEKLAISDKICSLCLIGLPTLTLLLFFTRHLVGVFIFKCPKAVFAGSCLTVAAISEYPFFSSWPQWVWRGKKMCLYTYMHTHRHKYEGIAPTHRVLYQTTWVTDSLSAHILAIPGFLCAPPFFLVQELSSVLVESEKSLTLVLSGGTERTRENNRRGIHFLIPLVLSSRRPWHIR